MRLRSKLCALSVLVAVCQVPQGAHAADRDEGDAQAAIRAEEERSTQIPAVVHIWADVHGSRLTGSPAVANAAQWAVEQLRAWGMSNAHLEPWVFGHPGWRNVGAEGQLLSPTEQPLSFGVAAWTPGTHGAVAAEVVLIDPPQETSVEGLEDYLRSVRAKVKGRIVMVGTSKAAVPEIRPSTIDADTVALLREGKAAPYTPDTPKPDILTHRQRDERIDAFLVEAGAAVRMDDAGRRPGGRRGRSGMRHAPDRTRPLRHAPDESIG